MEEFTKDPLKKVMGVSSEVGGMGQKVVIWGCAPILVSLRTSEGQINQQMVVVYRGIPRWNLEPATKGPLQLSRQMSLTGNSPQIVRTTRSGNKKRPSQLTVSQQSATKSTNRQEPSQQMQHILELAKGSLLDQRCCIEDTGGCWLHTALGLSNSGLCNNLRGRH